MGVEEIAMPALKRPSDNKIDSIGITTKQCRGRDAKAAWRDREVTWIGACKARALALLDNPITLKYLREYFEFLGSQKLFYCKVCDEEWPVFDKEWPQSGARTAGELAGVCETIKYAGFQADAKKKECCSRCASAKSSYRQQYCKENLQHLGPRHPAISNLKKPTTANRARLEAALEELKEYMPDVYSGSHQSNENLANFPHGHEVEMEEEECAPARSSYHEQYCEENLQHSGPHHSRPASPTGHEEEAPTTATGQEKKSAATGDNEQALAEAPTTATGQQEKSAATGAGDRVPMWHTDEVAGSIPGVFPCIFQNKTGDPCIFKFVKPDLLTWGPHVLRSRGWVAQANMAFMYWWMNRCQRIKALSAKKWFIKDNPKATGCTAAIIKKIDGYTQNIPGTRGSKIRLREIIVAMVRQMKIETHRPPDCLGDMPSLFGTLTSQWYYWDEIIRLIANVEGISEDYKTLNKSKRCELINKYPLFVSWYCAVRLELTLKTLVVPIFGASNYVAVFQWSPTGGMLQLHYILWKHGVPRFDLRAEQLVQETERLRIGGLVAAAEVQTMKTDDVMEFFAQYVSKWNPNKEDAAEEKEEHVAYNAMYCTKYCTMHDKIVDDRFALYNILDNMNPKDEDEWEKENEYWEDAKFDGQLDKAFMPKFSEEMCQAEVAHHANHIPEFFCLAPSEERSFLSKVACADLPEEALQGLDAVVRY